MGHIRIPSDFFAKPELAELSNGAKLLYLAGLAFSSAKLTEGRLGRGAVRIVCAYADVPAAVAEDLVTEGLWAATGDGYEIVDYLDCEIARPLRAQDVMRREWTALAPTLRPLVLARDGAKCAQCGATERLQIDHIYPIALGGTNDLDNLQVLCQPHNGQKGPRVDGLD